MDAEEQRSYLQQRRSSHEGASSSNQAGAVPTSPSPAGVSPSPGGRPSSAGGAPGAGSGYHFICECFFLTAKGLSLGLIKAITESSDLHRVCIQPCEPSIGRQIISYASVFVTACLCINGTLSFAQSLTGRGTVWWQH